MFDYTTVLGVDNAHLHKLQLVWPTWLHHKPDILNHPMVIFFDKYSTTYEEVRSIVPEHKNIVTVAWPPSDVEYVGQFGSKWSDPQRYKMLSGFIHVPPVTVRTPYWLKLDLDTVAMGMPDWIDPAWFEDKPATVCHPWGYTKPPEQMLQLDQWVERCGKELWVAEYPPLDLKPKPESSLVKHKRIISWCGFFHTNFTAMCSRAAIDLCGVGKLPVRSQDGYLWYMAKRSNCIIRRQNMKSLGWKHCSSTRSIRNAAEESLAQ